MKEVLNPAHLQQWYLLLYICVHWTLLQDASERAGGRDGRMEENQTEDEAWLHLGQQLQIRNKSLSETAALGTLQQKAKQPCSLPCPPNPPLLSFKDNF